MKLRLVRVAKGRLDWADAAALDYTRRLKRYAPFEEVVIRPGKAATAKVLQRLRPRDRLIALDERGEAASSEGWAAELRRCQLDGVGTLWFAIGGPDGHDPRLRQRADRVLRLAPMVLGHQIARVVVLEQLYRAWTLVRGEPYHRG